MVPTCALCGRALDPMQSVPSPIGPVHAGCTTAQLPATRAPPLPAYGMPPPPTNSPRIAPTEPMAMVTLYGAPPWAQQQAPAVQPVASPPVAFTPAPASADRPSAGALVLVYLSVLVPGGALVMIAVASLLYARWRGATPRRAKRMYLHAWIAFALGLAVWGTLAALLGNELLDEV